MTWDFPMAILGLKRGVQQAATSEATAAPASANAPRIPELPLAVAR
jgi:hypothetical protein